jgi:hypothetical protein
MHFWPRADTQIAMSYIRTLKLAPVGALTVLLCISHPAEAAGTSIALTTGTPALTPLATCISRQLADSGREVSTPQLKEGLEFRIIQTDHAESPQIVAITGLLKPNVSALTEQHDDDPEAQPAAASRVYELLRIHIGTRAWLRQPGDDTEICREASAWIRNLRSRPILFDRIGADGEARPATPNYQVIH